uniref:Uncharacterized protein n=1 Tax=Panagrolaimus sp. JU765 TaxID=591449 RepID=A0AC34RNM4_9BILA
MPENTTTTDAPRKSSLKKSWDAVCNGVHLLNGLAISPTHEHQKPFVYNHEMCQNVNLNAKHDHEIVLPFSGN